MKFSSKSWVLIVQRKEHSAYFHLGSRCTSSSWVHSLLWISKEVLTCVYIYGKLKVSKNMEIQPGSCTLSRHEVTARFIHDHEFTGIIQCRYDPLISKFEDFGYSSDFSGRLVLRLQFAWPYPSYWNLNESENTYSTKIVYAMIISWTHTALNCSQVICFLALWTCAYVLNETPL